MLEDFGKKIQHDQLQENYFQLCAKKNSTLHSADSVSEIFVYPPTYSSVLSLAYLQSVLFVDVLSKWSSQHKNTCHTHHTIQIDPMYLQNGNESLDSQSQSVLDIMYGLGVVHKQQTYDVAFADFVSSSLSELYRKGAVNYSYDVRYWSIEGQTVISDSQLVKEPIQTTRLYVKFFIDMKKHTITAGIDDPIYLFGVTAIGVNPYDKRYRKLVGKKVILPIVNRKVPIIADDRIDMTQESGAILLYPAHNRQHFMIAKDHKVVCDALAIDSRGNFTHLAGEFAGKNAYDFRENIVQYLQDISNLESMKQIDSFVYKDKFHTDHTLLPLATQQWFFDHINQHLTDTLQVYTEGTESDELLQEFFVSEPSCISKQQKHSLRFPILKQADGTVEFLDSHVFSALVSDKQTDSSNALMTHVVLLAILLGHLETNFTLHSFVDYMHQSHLDYGYVYASFYSHLKSFYAGDSKLSSWLDNFADLMHTSFSDSTLFDDVAMLLDESQGLVCSEDGMYSFDWQALGYSEGTELVSHTVSTSFLAALNFLYSAPVKKPENLVVAVPRTMFYRAKYVLSSEFIAAEQSSLFVFDSHAEILLDSKALSHQKDLWGYDAVRACIIDGSFGADGDISAGSAELYHRFTTKLWNSSRYIYKSYLADNVGALSIDKAYARLSESTLDLNDFDVWILLKINHVIEEVEYYLQRKNIKKVLNILTKFVWYDFSDSYLEITKNTKSDHAKDVLIYAMGVILQLLYPLFPFVTTSLWKFFGFEGDLSQNVVTPLIQGIEKNYKFGLLMDLVSKWNHLHANNRSTHLYDDLHLCLQANRDFIEYAKQYETLICTMTDALKLSFFSTQDILDSSWFTDSLIDITVGVQYATTHTPHQTLQGLEFSLRDKQQMLQNIRSITLTLDHSSPSYAEYLGKIQDLKNEIDGLELSISKLKYS